MSQVLKIVNQMNEEAEYLEGVGAQAEAEALAQAQASESINYKLARQLKDAGFPQQYDQDHERYSYLKGIFIGLDMDDASCFIPSLSELIQVCGDHFLALERSGDDWLAHGGRPLKEGGPCQWDEKGKTPEEAVARL